MADEGKGDALAILGIVAVIAVVGLVLLFTGTTGKVSIPGQKVYGGVNYGEEFPYLVDRTAGGYPPDGAATRKRQPRNVPSGQICSSPDAPGFRCPQGTSCIESTKIAESGGWVPAPEHPCYKRVSQI